MGTAILWERGLVLIIYNRFLRCPVMCLSEADTPESLTSDSEARSRASATS